MNDNEYLNILEYGKPSGTISIKPHPEDVIDVDPEIIANYKSFLKDETYTNAYDISDRIIDELSLQREKTKLKRIFGSSDQVIESASSINNIKIMKEDIKFEEVDMNLLRDYSFIKSGEENIDLVDFLKWFLFDEVLVQKQRRVLCCDGIISDKPSFKHVLEDYQCNHFDVLRISREVIQLNQSLLELFKDRKLVSMFDSFLSEFYRLKI